MSDMKLSREWLLRVAKEEEDVRFSVGGWTSELNPVFSAEVAEAAASSNLVERSTLSAKLAAGCHPAPFANVFGQFLNMARREKGLSVQQFAVSTGIDPLEVLLMEEGKEVPEPRIVSKIAQAFDVPTRKLAQLVGHIVPDAGVTGAALAFAASSSTKPLEPDQKRALHEFIDALTQVD
jgi:transcriptional regulator with XRE-family HTH domain